MRFAALRGDHFPGLPMTDAIFLTQAEAAELLRLSPRTLERLRVEGTGPRFVKAGRRVLYPKAGCISWADERTFASTAEAEAAARTGAS